MAKVAVPVRTFEMLEPITKIRTFVSNPTIRGYASRVVDVSKKIEIAKESVKYENKKVKWENALPYESIPGPPSIPIIGNMWRFFPLLLEIHKTPLHTMHEKMKEKYGDVLIFKGVLGRDPVVVLYNPEDMENVLRNCDPLPHRHMLEAYVNYRTVIKKDLFSGSGGLLAIQGEEWSKARSLMNPVLMQPKIVDQYIPKVDKVAIQLVENMKHFRLQNEKREMPDDFITELFKWGLESIGVIAFDRYLGCLDPNIDKNSESRRFMHAVTDMFECSYYLEVLPPFWKFFPIRVHKRFLELMDYITSTSLKYIDEALDKSTNRSGVLHQLADRCDRQLVNAVVMDMLVAGIETTGITLASVLYMLARHPEKQAKLREEVMNNLPAKTSPVTSEVLRKSLYVKAVIKETTRIAPVVIGTLRTLTKDLVVGRYQIPKGSPVACVHFFPSNSNYFKDPKEFIPERWLRTTTDEYTYKNAHAFAYMPFGFGVRTCLGKRFANLELEVATIRVIRNLKLSWRYGDMRFAGKIFHGPDEPLKIATEEVD